MDKKRTIVFVVSFVLIVFIVFSAVRTGVTASAIYCSDCSKVEDCKSYCADVCVKKGYDKILTTGTLEEDKIMCACECQSQLHNLITG